VAVETSVLTISCDDCALHATSACEDCVVSFLLDHDPADAIVIDAAEARAVRLLEGVGLLPGIKHQRRAG
jgi:hypothetical protein